MNALEAVAIQSRMSRRGGYLTEVQVTSPVRGSIFYRGSRFFGLESLFLLNNCMLLLYNV